MKKRIGAVGMAILAGLSMVACNPAQSSKPSGDGVKITVINFDGGVGTQWLRDASARFQKEVANKTYANGQTGAWVDITPNMSINTGTMATAGYNIYFVEGSANVYTLAQEGKLFNISDVVGHTVAGESETIGDKIDDGFKTKLKGEDGNFYALPHYEWMPGVSYDVDLFETGKYYFAKPDATSARSPKDKSYGDIKFTNDLTQKSCGPDGRYGTQDDGLPSSLQELFILCAELKATGCTPIALPGLYKNYSTYLMEALWASLSSEENARAVYTQEAKEYEIVVGYNDNQELFQGFTGIASPELETVSLTKDNAHLVYDTSARYYAVSALKAIINKGWIDTFSPNTSHTEAQEKFIFGGAGGNKNIGMLIDGSYWWNESQELGTFDLYEESFPEKADRRLRFMSLPTQVKGSVSENNGKEALFYDSGYSYCLMNANIKDASVIEACKDFLKFLYSDKELSAFTAATGCARNLKYELTETDKASLNDYMLSVWELRGKEGANVIYPMTKDSRGMSLGNTVFWPKLGTVTYKSYYEAFLDVPTAKPKDVFEITKLAR